MQTFGSSGITGFVQALPCLSWASHFAWRGANQAEDEAALRTNTPPRDGAARVSGSFQHLQWLQGAAGYGSGHLWAGFAKIPSLYGNCLVWGWAKGRSSGAGFQLDQLLVPTSAWQPSEVSRRVTVISLAVRVPVLSEQMTLQQPGMGWDGSGQNWEIMQPRDWEEGEQVSLGVVFQLHQWEGEKMKKWMSFLTGKGRVWVLTGALWASFGCEVWEGTPEEGHTVVVKVSELQYHTAFYSKKTDPIPTLLIKPCFKSGLAALPCLTKALWEEMG